MKRRELFTIVGGAATWPLVTRAQQPAKTKRIAIVSTSTPVSDMRETGGDPAWALLLRELHRLGYVEGSNLVVLRFSGGADTARYDAMIGDVVRAAPNLIVAASSRLVLRLKAATNTIPVIGIMADPLAYGIVDNLARPSGNITGITVDAGLELWGKRLAVLQEAVPTATIFGVLCMDEVWSSVWGTVIREAAQHIPITLFHPPLRGALQRPEFRGAFELLKAEHAQGLVVGDQAENYSRRRIIVELAEEAALPTIYPSREYVEVGGLMAYAVDLSDVFLRAASYAELIFKGAKPSELPIYQVAKFHLIINLKTAKTLSLKLPSSLLARADEVIE